MKKVRNDFSLMIFIKKIYKKVKSHVCTTCTNGYNQHVTPKQKPPKSARKVGLETF